MRFIVDIFNVFAYVFLVSPPRALDQKRRETKFGGELARQPLIVIIALDLLIRITALAVIALGIENLLGDELYESYRLDLVFVAIVFLGGSHHLVYYLVFAVRHPVGRIRPRIYRLLRNLLYTPLPSIAAIIPVMAYEFFHGMEAYESLIFQSFAPYVLSATLFAGLTEAAIGNRKPAGVDAEISV